jgi:starvation-inducible DNA-binding protein
MTTKGSRVRSFRTGVDIPPDSRVKIYKVLNQHLADSFDLMSHVKQAHWNVKGSDFWQLHKLFDEVAERASEWVDEFAERITALGGYATGTVRMAAGSSTLPEFPTEITESMDHVHD